MVVIDNLKAERFLCQDDVISSLILPDSVNSNVNLPFTTSYGGMISYESNSSALTSDGIVTLGNESQIVNLTVKVTGFDFEVNYVHEVKVSGKNQKTPIEINFIDVSFAPHFDAEFVHGDEHGKPCGERTRIQGGNQQRKRGIPGLG